MASLSTDDNDNRTIQFAFDKKRRTIRLGQTTEKDARLVKRYVESIVSKKILNLPFDSEISTWIAGLDDITHSKLNKVGLVEPRKLIEPAKVLTLGKHLDELLERRKPNLKPGTIVSYGHTIRNLKEFFGEEKPLREITARDGDDFKRYLKKPSDKNSKADGDEANADEAKRRSHKKPRLAPATVVRRCQYAYSFFKDAFRGRLIDSNPFEGLGKGKMSNPKRKFFVDHETIYRVIDACPNIDWKLLVALSRFGGLRVPSEPLLLRWQDVDTVNWERMLVHSPKTEHHDGHETREVPIFGELRPFLMESWELAKEGAEFVLPTLQREGIQSGDWRNVNFGTSFIKIVKKALIKPWPKIWHNLRSSRQTELTDMFPSHVVVMWLGNSEKVADEHYLQVLDSHWEKALQIPVQQPPETPGNGQRDQLPIIRQAPENHGKPMKTGVNHWAILDSNQ